MSDLTEQLKESEARLRRMTKVFMDAADPMLIQDLQLRVLDWNDEATRVFGWTREELVGRVAREVMVAPEWHAMLSDAWERCRGGEAVRNLESVAKSKQGHDIPVLVTASLLKDVGGEPIGIAVIAKDISELKRLSTELERKNEKLERFAGTLAHDLQGPLASIHTFCTFMQVKAEKAMEEDTSVGLEKIREATDWMSSLISGLLDFARLGEQDEALAPTDCNEVFKQAVANLEGAITDSGARVRRDELPTIQAHRQLLTLVFQNLIENSIKFRGATPPRIHVSAEPCDGGWMFQFRDNGIGLDLAAVERIFDPLVQLHSREKYGGHGIGLATCQRVIEHHGGQIWTEPAPNGGATILFSLPSA